MDSTHNIIANLQFNIAGGLASIKAAAASIDNLRKRAEVLKKSLKDVKQNFNIENVTGNLGQGIKTKPSKTNQAEFNINKQFSLRQMDDEIGKTNKLISVERQRMSSIQQLNSAYKTKIGVVQKEASASSRVTSATQVLTTKQNQLRSIMRASGLELNRVSTGLNRMGYKANQAGHFVNELGKKFEKTNANLKQLQKSSARFQMGLLSIMFGGMAIARVFGGLLRSMITSFKKANEDTEGLGKSTWELSAAWEFFKYSLIDALTSSEAFGFMVQQVIKFVQWLNKLSPTTKSIIAIGIAFLFVAGTALSALGSMGLFIGGLDSLGIAITGVKALGFLAFLGELAIGIFLLAAAFIGAKHASEDLIDIFGNASKATDDTSSGINYLTYAIETVKLAFSALSYIVQVFVLYVAWGMAYMVLVTRNAAKEFPLQMKLAWAETKQDAVGAINFILDSINAVLRGISKISNWSRKKLGLEEKDAFQFTLMETEGIDQEVKDAQDALITAQDAAWNEMNNMNFKFATKIDNAWKVLDDQAELAADKIVGINYAVIRSGSAIGDSTSSAGSPKIEISQEDLNNQFQDMMDKNTEMIMSGVEKSMGSMSDSVVQSLEKSSADANRVIDSAN